MKQVHSTDEINTQCPLCDRISNRNKIANHLRQKHNVAGSKWDDKTKQYIVPKQIEWTKLTNDSMTATIICCLKSNDKVNSEV